MPIPDILKMLYMSHVHEKVRAVKATSVIYDKFATDVLTAMKSGDVDQMRDLTEELLASANVVPGSKDVLQELKKAIGPKPIKKDKSLWRMKVQCWNCKDTYSRMMYITEDEIEIQIMRQELTRCRKCNPVLPEWLTKTNEYERNQSSGEAFRLKGG